jgi:protein-S-isoprenylcysteine O-methyltransferase Ste14
MAAVATYAYIILLAGWVSWGMPFVRVAWKKRPRAEKTDRRARWGLLLESIAYAILWQNNFWERPSTLWRVVFSIALFVCASLFSWTAARALGRQWRIDAGLYEDHELVTWGPYRLVRHPIYSSMLCVLLGTGFLVTPLLVLLIATLLFLAGTEIRIRVEEGLLASRFTQRFAEYRRKTPAYIPFVR